MTERRFEVGDVVRFRPGYNTPSSYGIQRGEEGAVVDVESESHMTGPTYRIEVAFAKTRLPWIFSSEFELVRRAGKNS